jgi:hypothetical protein
MVLSWKLEIGNRKLEIGNRKLEAGRIAICDL